MPFRLQSGREQDDATYLLTDGCANLECIPTWPADSSTRRENTSHLEGSINEYELFQEQHVNQLYRTSIRSVRRQINKPSTTLGSLWLAHGRLPWMMPVFVRSLL